MNFLWQLIGSVGRIVFLRGSPERIYYTRRLFIVSMLGAVVLSAMVQWWYFTDHVVFIVLRVFCEVTIFMLMIVFLTAKITRFRLARMMLVLVLINLIADSILLIVSPAVQTGMLTERPAQIIAFGIAAGALYGAMSVLAWGLNKPLYYGAGVAGGYVAGVVALDESFKHLYSIMAGA